MSRQEVLQQLADIIVSIKQSQPLRVAIDGIDAAGKTTLAGKVGDKKVDGRQHVFFIVVNPQ